MSNATLTTDAPKRHQIDAYAVALDLTDQFEIDRADAPYIESIRSVFAFDRNQRTHLCELAPSYFLLHLYDEIYWTDAGDQLDDWEKNRLQEAYCYTGTEDDYWHCRDIDRLIEQDAPSTVEHYGDVVPSWRADKGTPEENHDADMEIIREELCANCPF